MGVVVTKFAIPSRSGSIPAAPHSRDRRRHRRSLCSEVIRISFEDQEGRRVTDSALLEDLSKRGASVSSSLPVGVGRGVQHEANGFERKAVVRYCEPANDGYVIGLEFDPGSDWDRGAWSPEHLMSLEE